MFSSQGAQYQGSILASIPFAKFSHTSNPPEVLRFTWNHIGRSDLAFVILSSRVALDEGTYRNRTFMKVMAGVDLLVRAEYIIPATLWMTPYSVFSLGTTRFGFTDTSSA